MTCKICKALEFLQTEGVSETREMLRTVRDEAIKKGYAPREDANLVCDLIKAGALLCRGERCIHNDGIDNLLGMVRESFPEKVPVSLYAGLYSDFDLVADSIRMNAP